MYMCAHGCACMCTCAFARLYVCRHVCTYRRVCVYVPTPAYIFKKRAQTSSQLDRGCQSDSWLRGSRWMVDLPSLPSEPRCQLPLRPLGGAVDQQRAVLRGPREAPPPPAEPTPLAIVRTHSTVAVRAEPDLPAGHQASMRMPTDKHSAAWSSEPEAARIPLLEQKTSRGPRWDHPQGEGPSVQVPGLGAARG